MKLKTIIAGNLALEIFMFLFLTLMGIFYIRHIYFQTKKTEIGQIMQISRSVEALLPVNSLLRLEAKSTDTIKSEYKIIKKYLREVVKVNNRARFAYFYLQRDNKIYFMVDSEPENSPDFSPPGQELTEADFETKQPFTDGKILVTKPSTDRWGTWVSTLIPIKKPGSEEIIAVFGMDYSAKSLQKSVLSHVTQSAVLTIALLLSVFLFFNMIKRNYVLKSETEKRLNASRALHESEKLYRNLFDNMLNGFAYCKMIFDNNFQPVDFIYLNVNKAFESLTGLKDVNGKRVTVVIPGIREKDTELFEIYAKTALTGEPVTFEYYLKSLGVWFLISVYGPQKEHFVTVFDVITDHKRVEEETKLNMFRMSALLELNKLKQPTLNDLYLHSIKKAIEMCRSEYGFLGILNEQQETVQIFSWSNKFSNERQPWNKQINKNSGSTDIWDDMFVKKIPVAANELSDENNWKIATSLKLSDLRNYVGIPLVDNDKVVAILINCNKQDDFSIANIFQLTLLMEGIWNIVKQRKYEDEIIIAKEKAIEGDLLKTAFLQNMSHEIRTPMNAIVGFSELLPGQFSDKTKLEYFTGIIIQRCKDLLQILNDILDLSRIESGQLSITTEECDLTVFFNDMERVFKEHQKRIGKDEINFRVNIECAKKEAAILTDGKKLTQIFNNLISNAFKFTENGQISIGCKHDKKNDLLFYVADTGIGILPDKHQMIFDRFIQIDQSKTRLYGGTGLGLTIAKGLVNLMDGDIWLESEPGKGTTFYFKIAYKKSQTMHQENFFVVESEEYFFPGKMVLIVEDDPDNAEFLKEILSDKGLTIVHTGYAKEAVKIALDQQVDFILMDINLPDMDGYQATRLIKQQKPDIKIIAQTAYAAQRDRQSAIDAGCDDYMSKPLKYELLLSMMKKHFSKT